MAISEANTLLEINESHGCNFHLVISKLPTTPFIGSVFNKFTKDTSSLSTGTSGISAIPQDCETVNTTHMRRESNLDMKNFHLYLSDVTIPSISVNKVPIATFFSTMHTSGKIDFSDLITTMMISENMLNYKIIQYWLFALHNPEEFNKISGRDMIDAFRSEIYLIITNNHKEKVAEYKFLDSFPINLDSLPLTYKRAEKLVTNVVWAHSGMIPSDNFVLKYI